MKLKTLEELQKECEWTFDTYNKLRQEAIKHIKQIRHAAENNGKGMPKFLKPFRHIEDWQKQLLSITVWIYHFFNIKEEELKWYLNIKMCQ